MPVLIRLRAAARHVRRAVLRRRRLLAALCAFVAVWAGLRATAAAPPSRVPVTVAAHDLGAGATLEAADVTTVRFASGTVPDGHVRDPVGRQLAGPVRRGQPITDTDLLGASLVRDRPDLVALPVRLPDTAVVELLRTGEQVDVTAADPQGGQADTVAHAALVLALPPAPDDAAADGLPGRVVVLGVHAGEVSALSEAGVTRFLSIVWSG